MAVGLNSIEFDDEEEGIWSLHGVPNLEASPPSRYIADGAFQRAVAVLIGDDSALKDPTPRRDTFLTGYSHWNLSERATDIKCTDIKWQRAAKFRDRR